MNQTKSSHILKFNIGIWLALVSLLAAYVVISNRLVADRFVLHQMQEELRGISEDVVVKEAVMARHQNRAALLALVRQSGMIANSDGQTLIITTDVALAR